MDSSECTEPHERPWFRFFVRASAAAVVACLCVSAACEALAAALAGEGYVRAAESFLMSFVCSAMWLSALASSRASAAAAPAEMEQNAAAAAFAAERCAALGSAFALFVLFALWHEGDNEDNEDNEDPRLARDMSIDMCIVVLSSWAATCWRRMLDGDFFPSSSASGHEDVDKF